MIDDNSKEELKACAFFGTMGAILCSGIALINDANASQFIGTAMVAWVVLFLLTMSACSSVRETPKPED